MDAIAKSLRAWTLPFSVPIMKSTLFESDNPNVLSSAYQCNLDLLIDIATKKSSESR
jgi:arsenic resistance protein ArsH